MASSHVEVTPQARRILLFLKPGPTVTTLGYLRQTLRGHPQIIAGKTLAKIADLTVAYTRKEQQ